MQSNNDEHNDEHNDITKNDNTKNQTSDQHGAPQLSDIELRVLGVLMEKQLTTPDQYPLTLNSVITACNQKSSREPVTNYNQGEVQRTLQELDNKHFIRKERSSRSEKFSQQFMHYLELGRKQQALLCVMMLRGPQSLSELSTRTQRMCDFTDKDELDHSIDRLCNRDVPYAIRLGQQPGQRGERIGHLFSGTPTAYSASTTQNERSISERQELDLSGNKNQPQHHDESIAVLELEVETLTKNLNALKSETAELKQQLAALYVLTGHATQT